MAQMASSVPAAPELKSERLGDDGMIFGELPSWLDVERSSVRRDCILAWLGPGVACSLLCFWRPLPPVVSCGHAGFAGAVICASGSLR